jgi:hypothetical protein
MDDPTKTFQPGKKITLYDKSKQKYAIGALLVNTKNQTPDPLPIQDTSISEEKSSETNIDQENYSDQSPNNLSWIQMLIIIITQIFWIYLLFINKITKFLINLIKQKKNFSLT